MGNFSDYAQDAFYANKALVQEAQASGLAREEIVAMAMALQPIAPESEHAQLAFLMATPAGG